MLAAITLGMFVPRVNSKVQGPLSRFSFIVRSIDENMRFVDSVRYG